MRSYNNLYEPMLQDDYIKQCFINASKKKKNRNDVREVLENLDEHTELLKKMLTEELFIPDYHKPSIINESSSKKTRRILKPHYKYEQVIHHCAIGQFKPIVMNGLYEFSCGSIPDRGVHYGKKYMRKWLDSYDGKKFFVLKMDVHHFFESINRRILKRKLNCMLKIMSKTDNSQTAFGQGQTSGYVNDASQNYGHLATGTLKDKGQFFGYNDTTHEVKVFYMEKPWGNRWDRINGLLMVGGEILAKMTPPYNLTGKDFEKVGITFTSSGNGYQKGTKSSRFGRIVNSIGGSSSTYTCDYFWWNAGITAVALVGGNCNNGESCGAACLSLSLSAGIARWNVGASVFLEQPIAA